MSVEIETGVRSVAVGNPDKVLFPDSGITKLDLATYHRDVAEAMQPHVRGRALTMHRFPDGIGRGGFYQKEVPDYFPDWIRTAILPKRGGEVTHVVVEDAATLVYLADQACITLHVTLSRVDDAEHPDRMVFDLDPPESADVVAVRSAARAVRAMLDELGLESRIMTSGSKGYHVVVPLDRAAPFAVVRDVARRIAGVVAARHPAYLTVEQRIEQRSGRVFLDYLRNAYAQTTVAPYAVRARPGAPIATPIDWHELSHVDPRSYTVDSIFRRLGQKEDPWTSDGIVGQSLETVSSQLAELEE